MVQLSHLYTATGKIIALTIQIFVGKEMSLPFNMLSRLGFPGSSGKESARNAGGPDSIPGTGRCPGKGNGNPLHYSCLGNPMDRQATVHGIAKNWTVRNCTVRRLCN